MSVLFPHSCRKPEQDASQCSHLSIQGWSLASPFIYVISKLLNPCNKQIAAPLLEASRGLITMSLWLEVLQEYEGPITAQRARAGDQRDHKTLICDQQKKERGNKKKKAPDNIVFSAVITTDIFSFIACRIDWFIALRIQSQCLCDWLYSNMSRREELWKPQPHVVSYFFRFWSCAQRNYNRIEIVCEVNKRLFFYKFRMMNLLWRSSPFNRLELLFR